MTAIQIPQSESSVLGVIKSFSEFSLMETETPLAPVQAQTMPDAVGGVRLLPSPSIISAISVGLGKVHDAVELEDSVVVEGRLRLGGQNFSIEHLDECVLLKHPRWSLAGAGDSLLDAEKDLRAEASELRHHLERADKLSFSSDMLRLYEFVTRIA